jgi:hypothetical protein
VQAERRSARGRERRRARAQEGARQEGASTGGRKHRRRKLRDVRVGGLPKEPANKLQSLRVKPPKYRNSFSFAGSFAGCCNSFMINVLINPQTTCKLPANVNSGLPNAVIVQEKYPELYPYVKMCYAKISHPWWDGDRMMSALEVQQGGPLGPLLFCLVIHPVLTEVAKQVVADFPDLTVEGAFKLFIFYLDDGYVFSKHAVLNRLGELLAPHGILLDDLPSPGISSSQHSASTTQVLVDTLACSVPRHLHNLAHDSGAHLNMTKSPAWWPNAPSADIIQKYEAAGVPFLRTEGVLVLKVPVWSDKHVRTQLVNKVEELRIRMQVLGDFQDTHAPHLMLRVCIGVCRVNFLLRVLPHPLEKDAADGFDDLLQKTFASISCAVLSDRVWTAAQLPFSPTDCPGLGLTSAKNIMSAAHLASLNGARSVLSKHLPVSLFQAFVSTPHVMLLRVP